MTSRRSSHRGSTSLRGHICSTARRTQPAGRRRIRAQSRSPAGPIIGFLLIACFGILFAGCAGVRGPQVLDEEVSFTEEDLAAFEKDLKDDQTSLSGAKLADLSGFGSTDEEDPVVDLSQVPVYAAIRSGPSEAAGNVYRVTNDFLNVRSFPRNGAAIVERLDGGVLLHVIEFLNAGWAKVKLGDGREGFVSNRYISKLTSEENLPAEKKAFEGLYYVSFGFVNVRAQASQQSDKLGEIPGETFVRPIAIQGDWAKIPFDGKEAYVSLGYLAPFSPNFLVRQDRYTLPIFHYQINQEGTVSTLKDHVLRLQREGTKFMNTRDFADLLLSQEQRDARLSPGSVLIAISGVMPDNIRAVSDAIAEMGVRVTVFIETQFIGLSGITEKQLLTLSANGADIQPMGHTGDDLRSLTNAQLDLELRQSRKILEDLTKKQVIAVAYPLGGVNERVMQRAAAAGYLFGLGSVPERTFSRSDLLRLPGYAVSSSLTSDDILKIVKGQ